MKIVKIKKIKREVAQTSKVYNISLEGNDQFFANGILNHNTLPHLIEAKNAQALHWKSGGKDMFAKSVQHPGTDPNPWIRETLRIDLPKIIENQMQKVFK